MKCIVVRYSEIGLKGKNKSDFEKKLVDNIRLHLKKQKIDFDRIQRISSRIVVFTGGRADFSGMFGVSSYSYGTAVEPDIESIKSEIEKQIKGFNDGMSFRISSQRIDKRFPITSPNLDREFGAFVVEKTGAKVDLTKFDKEVGVEILPKLSIVFNNRHIGPGGLPSGVEGVVLALIEGKDSIEAASLVMKRGCDVIPVGYEKKDILALENISPKKLSFYKIKNIKELEGIAEKNNAKALVVGETLEGFKEIDTKLLVFRPLIAK